MKEEDSRRVPLYVYEGLGFPVILEEIFFYKKRGEWLPNIDIELLGKIAFKGLIFKPAKLTGNEIRFIREYAGMPRSLIGRALELSSFEVEVLENTENSFVPFSDKNDSTFRVYFMLYLEERDEVFFDKISLPLLNAFNSKENLTMRIATEFG